MKPIDFADALAVSATDLPLRSIMADCYVVEGDSLMQPVTDQARALLSGVEVPDLLLEQGGVLKLQVGSMGNKFLLIMARPGDSLESLYEQIVAFVAAERFQCVAFELLGCGVDTGERITALFTTVLTGLQSGRVQISTAGLAPEVSERVFAAIKYYYCE